MKRSELKQIIKEELKKILTEDSFTNTNSISEKERNTVNRLFDMWEDGEDIKNKKEYTNLSTSAKNKLDIMIRNAEQMES